MRSGMRDTSHLGPPDDSLIHDWFHIVGIWHDVGDFPGWFLISIVECIIKSLGLINRNASNDDAV